jgi:hypothetical protein
MSYSVDISDLPDNAPNSVIKRYIRKQIKKCFRGPQKRFLLTCAYWDPSSFNSKKWIARSPIESRNSGDDWPLYDISDLTYSDADESNIEYHSYKDDYATQTHGRPHGNLGSMRKPKNYKGKIWTRGE